MARANSPNRAGLVIRYGDGSMWTKCIEFSEPELTGLELLLRSGLRIVTEEGGPFGSAVCKIEQDGCDYPLDDCFCKCMGADCTYWAYYHLRPNGTWEYSTVGASSYIVHHGDVEGWSWGPGTYGEHGTEPPVIRFEQICAPPPTPTDTVPPTPTQRPVPTDTATPRPTATATLTRVPSATPTATLPPTPTRTPTSTMTHALLSIEFWADRTEIRAGECINLGWRISGAIAVYLDGQGVIGEETRQVCPPADTRYTLRVVSPIGETVREVFVRVIPVTSTPIPTLTFIPTFTPAPIRAVTPSPPARAAVASVATLTPMPPTATLTRTPAPSVTRHTDTPAALVFAPTSTDTPQPTSTFTEVPPTATPLHATAMAMAVMPTDPPQVWARAYVKSGMERSQIPTPVPTRAPSHVSDSSANASWPSHEWLLNYGVFFFMAALLTGLAAWVTRRQLM